MELDQHWAFRTDFDAGFWCCVILPQRMDEIMNVISDTLTSFFAQEDWAVTKGEDGPPNRFFVPFQGENGQWTCVALALDTQEQMIFYSVVPVPCPEDKRTAMMDFLHRVNYGLHVGNFEFDIEDGEIRFKTSVDVEGCAFDAALCRNAIFMNCVMMDHHLPGIMGIIYGALTPVDALQKIRTAPAATS